MLTIKSSHNYCSRQHYGFLARLDKVYRTFQSAIALPPVSASASASASASIFTLKSFKNLYFPDHLIGLVHIWYDDRYSSKVLFSNTPAYYLKVKVMDLENFKFN